MILDACFSGQTSSGPLVPGLQPLVPVAATSPRRAVLLTAASQGQYAGPLPGLDRPAFSYLVLGALRGWADADRDRSVSAGEAYDYTTKVLASFVRDRVQRPTLAGAANSVVSRVGVERGPDLDALLKAIHTR